jgi:hypothetical protein
VNTRKLVSALSLVAFVPCVLSGQNPAPSYQHPAAPQPAAAPAARRMVLRSIVDRRMPANGMMMDAASFFLGCTGELQLTDAQVTKLAAIARRAEGREHAMRARMDSAMVAMRSDGSMPHDGAGGGTMMTMIMRMPMPTEAERKAQHEDDRDAFAVLTPDQLATAWEKMHEHHAMAGKVGM